MCYSHLMIKWRLREYLKEHDLSAYALTKVAPVAPNTVYGLARGDQTRVDLEVLDGVLSALGRLTGKTVTASDILSHKPDPEPMDDETRAWLDAGLAELAKLEPYEWDEGEADEGEPLSYTPGQGWVAGD